MSRPELPPMTDELRAEIDQALAVFTTQTPDDAMRYVYLIGGTAMTVRAEARHRDEIKATGEWQHDVLEVLGEVEAYARRMTARDEDAADVSCISVGRNLLEILGDRWTRRQ